MTDAVLVYVTVPSAEVGALIARTLVEERLAACGNLVGGLRSIYRWQGEIHDEPELLLFLKTQRARFDEVKSRIGALHPYQVPSVVMIPIEQGLSEYLGWIRENVR
jgi:periplasmic divalent cation tolerance protein